MPKGEKGPNGEGLLPGEVLSQQQKEGMRRRVLRGLARSETPDTDIPTWWQIFWMRVGEWLGSLRGRKD
jgi:hypothetical protein